MMNLFPELSEFSFYEILWPDTHCKNKWLNYPALRLAVQQCISYVQSSHHDLKFLFTCRAGKQLF